VRLNLLITITFLLAFTTSKLLAQHNKKLHQPTSPLAKYSPEWNSDIYKKCNTAVTVSYLSAKEKQFIYILNLMRSNPALFAKTVLPKVNFGITYNYETLMDTLLKAKPMQLLLPDKKCFASAKCHATSSGIEGYTGHNRLTKDCEKQEYYNAEGIHYGPENETALEILMSQLIDEGVPSLGHRHNCMNGDFKLIGVSIQPHKNFGINAVIDFKF
jgi:hypothetical protein